MTTALLAGLLAGYAIAIPVGAIGAYLIGLTARTNLRIGLSAAFGVATVDGAYALVAVLGGAALAPVVARYDEPLRAVSVGVLAVLAAVVLWRSLREYRVPESGDEPGERMTSPPKAYWTLVGLTSVNPTTVVYFAALVVGHSGSVTATPLHATVFVAAAFAASASWQCLLAGGGALLGSLLSGSRGRLATSLVSSALIAAFAVHLALGG
ncbi:LysE family transporter [Haloechinothrix salitolerans]|uniref:LysE family transporter n=1 Tax=Haloechinothrix salitolerans TaxID=926830 RepID=A0ABW2BUF1_9PSEU